MNASTLMNQLPGESLLALTDRARTQVVEKWNKPAELVDQAAGLVAAGRVELVDRNRGWVYDHGGYAEVFMGQCGHGCRDLCVHKLAVAFADLLQRHAPPQPEPERAAASGTVAGLGPGFHGRGRRSSSGRKSTCASCEKCGFFRHGTCKNPNKRRR